MSYESTQTRIFLQDYLCNLLVSSKNVLVKIRVSVAMCELIPSGCTCVSIDTPTVSMVLARAGEYCIAYIC